MAFSSSSHKTPLEEADENDGDWLQLGLGLGFSTHHHQLTNPLVRQHQPVDPVSFSESNSSSTQLQPEQVQKKQIGLGLDLALELGVGFETNQCLRVREVAGAPPRNYHSCFWWQGQDDDDGDGEKCDDGNHRHHGMLSSWPWHMHQYTSGAFLGLHDDDDDDWQVPVPNHSHNCSTTTIISSRPHRSGLWFTLQSSINRDGEALPQIPKAYIRVKDESMTVFMVKKYLVTKLGLSNEAEIEIWCMGQKLSHTQTLKQVRDCVWLPRLVESVSSTSANMSSDYSHSTSINHLMSLNYGKRCVLS